MSPRPTERLQLVMKGSPVRVRASALKSPGDQCFSLVHEGRDRKYVPNRSRQGAYVRGTMPPLQPPTGHVFLVDSRRGPQWYAKYRLPDGRQIQRRLGPAWTERGRPLVGYFTKLLAEDWLRDTLDEARRGILPVLVRTGATVADAAAEYLRYIEHDRNRKPSTVAGYRWVIEAAIVPAIGSRAIESVTSEDVEEWFAGLGGKPSSRMKTLVILRGIFERARRIYSCRPIRPATSSGRHCGAAATSRSSRPRRSGRSCARPRASRTPRSS